MARDHEDSGHYSDPTTRIKHNVVEVGPDHVPAPRR